MTEPVPVLESRPGAALGPGVEHESEQVAEPEPADVAPEQSGLGMEQVPVPVVRLEMVLG